MFLTRWQSPPDSTSWMKTAGPSGLLEPPPMVIPKLLDRATEISWITPSPGWLRTQRHINKHVNLWSNGNRLHLCEWRHNIYYVCMELVPWFVQNKKSAEMILSQAKGAYFALHCWPEQIGCKSTKQLLCKCGYSASCPQFADLPFLMTGEQSHGWYKSCKNNSYLRERSMGPLLLYMFWDPAGLNNKGLWERDEEPDDVLSR